MLWQMAYTEMYFTDVLWPGFTSIELETAICWFKNRDRRYGAQGKPIAA
jgi:undecaprenyl diphosphate synthase